METVLNLRHAPDAAREAVIAIGNFDGVHLGHRAVIGAAQDVARRLGTASAVLTFEPHPIRVMRPDQMPGRLTPLRAKAREIERLGVDWLHVLRFNRTFSRQAPEAFVRQILAGWLGARHVVTGHDFSFGHRRAGNAALLEQMAATHGFGFTAVAAVAGPEGTYSSTRARAHLCEGRPAEAARILGRPWEIEGRVQHGDRRGRTIGFPTANVLLGAHLEPALGVYAIRARLDAPDAPWWDGVANIGRRPTFGGAAVVLEAHLFDRSDDLYGRRLRVALVDHLRAERRFDGVASLTAQIDADCRAARDRLAHAAAPVSSA